MKHNGVSETRLECRSVFDASQRVPWARLVFHQASVQPVRQAARPVASKRQAIQPGKELLSPSFSAAFCAYFSREGVERCVILHSACNKILGFNYNNRTHQYTLSAESLAVSQLSSSMDQCTYLWVVNHLDFLPQARHKI